MGTARGTEAMGRSVPSSPHPLAGMLSLPRASQYREAVWPCSLSPSPLSCHAHARGPSPTPCPIPTALPHSLLHVQSVPTDLLVQGSPWCPAPSHPHCCVVSDQALPLIQPCLPADMAGLGCSWGHPSRQEVLAPAGAQRKVPFLGEEDEPGWRGGPGFLVPWLSPEPFPCARARCPPLRQDACSSQAARQEPLPRCRAEPAGLGQTPHAS